MQKLIVLVLIFFSGTVHALDYAKPVSKEQAFLGVTVGGRAGLKKTLSSAEARQVNRIITQFKCPARNISLYARAGYQVKVMAVECQHDYATSEDYEKSVEFLEYPLVIVINRGSVQRVENFREFGFMYESGAILSVSDIDRNGAPEFVLGGAVCECDGVTEAGESCDCQGTVMAEARNGKLVMLKEK